jgi:hypothetical protein
MAATPRLNLSSARDDDAPEAPMEYGCRVILFSPHSRCPAPGCPTRRASLTACSHDPALSHNVCSARLCRYPPRLRRTPRTAARRAFSLTFCFTHRDVVHRGRPILTTGGRHWSGGTVGHGDGQCWPRGAGAAVRFWEQLRHEVARYEWLREGGSADAGHVARSVPWTCPRPDMRLGIWCPGVWSSGESPRAARVVCGPQVRGRLEGRTPVNPC